MIGNIIAIYRYLGQDAFISETILIAICSLLQNRRFCLIFGIGGFVSFSISADLSHFRNRRICPVSRNGDFVSNEIGSSILPPLLNNTEVHDFSTVVIGIDSCWIDLWPSYQLLISFKFVRRNLIYEMKNLFLSSLIFLSGIYQYRWHMFTFS